MKTRQTVNGLNIQYDETNDVLRFEKNGVALSLMMGEDNLNLLYQMTPYLRYKNYLLAKQGNRCTECARDLSTLKANEYALHHDPRLGDKGSRYIDFNGVTKNRIVCNECHGKQKGTTQLIIKNVSKPTAITSQSTKSMVTPQLKGTVEDKLSSLGYQNTKGKTWVKNDSIVHLEQTKDNTVGSILIYWRENWKDDHAIVFDYSYSKCAVCIVPIDKLFSVKFVLNKRAEGYGDSLNWWSQKFPLDHPLAQLVLSYQNRWDILQ